MSDSPHFSPELEGLLREAAADPRSVLLRVPRPSPLRSLLARQEPLTPTATGLAALDRHLLAVHREELAEALLEGCLVRLYSNPDWGMRVNRARTPTEDWAIETPVEWAKRTRTSAEVFASLPCELVGIELLQACVSPGGLDGASLTQLARAALRLVPGGRARAWIAIDLRLADRFADAIRLVDQELAHHVRPSLASTLLECRASALSCLGDYAGATRDAWRSHLENGDQITALVNGMHYALLAGDQAAAERTGAALDASVAHPTGGLLHLFDVFVRMVREGQVAILPSNRTIARALLDSAGPLAKKVLDVYSD